MDDEKWIVYNNVEVKRLWGKQMNHHQGWFSSKDSDVVCMVGLEGVYYELLLEKQSIISNKSCSQLDKLKAILEQKASGISQQKTHTLPS